jgi:hypothetical protein
MNGLLGLSVAWLLAVSGCSNNCGSNCPATMVTVYATPGENLSLSTASAWTGPACPPGGPMCSSGDGVNPCTFIEIIPLAPGSCELSLVFTDGRAPATVTATFGPATTQGCCKGFPAETPAQVTLPPFGSTADAAADAAASNDAVSGNDDAAADAD